MAYRFTNTEKWNDNWFCELKPLSKLLFLYLCDQCDVAGFIEVNLRKISFDLGIGKQEAERGMKEIEARLLYSIDGRFVFIKNFLKHQKNDSLNEKNNAHKGIISRLNENLQLFGFQDINDFFNKPLTSPCLGASEPLPRGTGNGKGKGKEEEEEKGGMGGKEEEGRRKPKKNDLIFPFESEIFKQKWDDLVLTPKWKKKIPHALQLSLNKLADFEEEFAVILVEEATEKGWAGVVFDGTKKRYEEWKNQKGGTNENRKNSIRSGASPEEFAKYINGKVGS